ncbi:MAG TPA: hypothetical protein ENL34_10580 [Chloroflexi bacterium]|nr:hypothetical protein [Chloroflexota bacterium]
MVEMPSEAPAEPSEREKIVPTDELVESEPIPVPPPELHSPREAAILLQTDDRDENWHSLLWALIAEDDLPAAYWLARSLVASERVSPVPDWLLAAAQGARWLSPDSDTFVGDLLEIVQNHHPTSDDVQELIGLATALRPALIAPFSGLVGWLKAPVCCPILHDLVTAVNTFASLSITLRPEDLLGVAGAEQREAALTEAVHDAKQWLDKAPGRRTKPKRALDVWRYLVKNDLQVLLLSVSKDQRTEVERVRQHLHPWQQRDYISDQIDQIDREIAKARFRPIVGPARQQLIRRVEEACRLASRWCNLVEHEREIETRGEWLTEQVATLRTRVQGTLPEVEKALDELGDSAHPASLAAASRCLRCALMQLRQTLHLPYEPSDTKSPAVKAQEWLPLNADNLYTALNRRLLWLPKVPLSENGQPLEESLSLIAQALRDACVEERSLRVAFEGWLQRQDYRFVERWLLDALRDEVDATELSRHYQEAIQGSRAALRDNINETSNAIEQALVDGIIADERSKYSAIVEDVNPAETLNFPLKYDELRKVRDSLLAARQKRLTALRVNWRGVQNQFETSHIEAAKQEVARRFVQAALDRGDTRVVEASLALLLEAIDTGGELDDRLFAPVETRDVLAEFLESAPRIEKWLEGVQGLQQVATDIRHGRTHAGIRFAEVPKKRREEAAKAVSSWRRLKQQRPGQQENPDHIATLLRYLGFSFELGRGTPVQVEGRGKGWLHVRASMSASDLARPIPQFGSQAHGHYDVICLWERPGAGTIAARLRESRLNVHNVLVFYLGRLTARQKRDVTRISREQRLALAVLDETLMVFLAQERDARLPIFLRCALPFAALNPYTPFQAGDVPPEMFFGREAMAHELQRPAGSCLVYGGRQLGKSALLRHVERQFSYPEREQYAWVKNLKLIFDPLAGKGTDNIWRELREDFKRERLISPQVRTDRPEEIARYIREAMLRSTDRRVLVMFDEADDFLDADSVDGFRVVTALRELMLETQRRFKVVFTGLHNVQRFQGIPNQPLAHFGAPLCVGPLEPDAAQQLVRQPLEALGYHFADDATVLRILSYTNYHPGLIQLFCQELLKRLHEPGVSTMPPYRIEQSDVEAVYRNREKVRKPIRERFDWTLALDMHYQAIAWTLIYDQMEMRDSYAQAYPPGDILKLVRDYWPQGFSKVGTEKLRSLLDEMRGLGVLVRNANGHYRLRSPNLVRLMGTETDIENRLSELSEKHPPVQFEADNHHAPLDDAARRYSPLTYSQERSLNPPQFGVGLVFASEALGLSVLPEASSRFVPRDENVGGFTEVSSSVASGERLRSWLDRHMQIHSIHERLVAYYRPRSKAPKDLESLVREALIFCDRHQSRRRWMRVLFLFDPQVTWAWLSLSPNIRESLENRAGAVVPSQRWNLSGVRRRLVQHDKMGSDAICEQILRATGGWPCLLDNLFDRCDRQSDPRPFAEAIERELVDSSLRLGQQFRQSLGLEGNDVARRVLDFVIRVGQWPADLVEPDLVGGEPVLTTEECTRAVEYLRRMGCVELHGDEVQAERIVEKVMPQL